MMTCRAAREQLSLLVDGHLPAVDRDAVEAHLDACEACRGVRQDLERLTHAAAFLGPIAPADHVWPQIAAQLGREPRSEPVLPVQVTTSRPAGLTPWVGLAAALLLITLGAYYFPRITPPPASSDNARANGSVEVIAEELQLATQPYERAIAELETLTHGDSDVLGPVTTDTLRQSLRTIDAAIGESRTALTENPGNRAARESLFEALRWKVMVLQATVTLMHDPHAGNQVGPIEAAGTFSKTS